MCILYMCVCVIYKRSNVCREKLNGIIPITFKHSVRIHYIRVYRAFKKHNVETVYRQFNGTKLDIGNYIIIKMIMKNK